MSSLRALLVRLGGAFGRRERGERELAEEMESHLQMEIEENLCRGMTVEEARRDALLKSGGLEASKDAWRDRRGLPAVENTIRDARHALRLLRRSPGFTTVAVLSLALGIGANTAIFTVLDQLLLRQLPVLHPEQLAMIWTTGPSLGSTQGTRGSSYPMYQDFQQRAEGFSYVFCRYNTPLSISVGNQAERVMGELVSGNYFQALGVRPALGRVFSPEEDDRVYKGHPVAVLSYPYWVARFGADAGVIGRKILVNNYPMVIVGVSAKGFSGMDPVRSPQIRIPIQMKPLMTPASDNLGDRRRQWVQVFARLKPGYTIGAARASLQTLLSGILRSEAEMPALRNVPRRAVEQFLARKVTMEPAANGYTELRSNYGAALAALMCMVGLVLLIACFNVAGLLIARAGARQRELAMRIAMGASRGQLLRQLLMESAVLAAAGAAIGLVLAGAMVRGLSSFVPANGMVATLRADPDWRVLLFSGTAALLAVLLFGLAPARQALHLNLWSALKEGAASAAGNRGSARLRKCLVTAQVAFSMLLVAGALLFVQTLVNLKQANSGFRDIGRLVAFQVDPARSGYSLPRLKTFYREALENVRALPQVEDAGYAWIEVMAGRTAGWDIAVEGRPSDGGDREAFVNGVSPGYWRTMGIPVVAGRDFDDGDIDGRPKVAIVNRRFADDFFGKESPLGRRIGLDTGPDSKHDIEIVGVVADSLPRGPRDGMRRQVFFPFPQMNQPVGVCFYVRTSAGGSGAAAMLRRKIREMDATLPVYAMKTVEQQLDETLGTERLTAALSGAFGVLATLLAAVGLYGAMALAVARRTREIGVRMAMGARRGVVVWMVMKEALGLLGVGLALGIAGACYLGRYLGPQLFGVTAGDMASGAGAMAVLAVVTLVAAYVPARRASRIDPMAALRQE